MTSEQIYIRFRGKTLGPLSTEKVEGLVKRGQITRLHELSSDGLSWVKAEDYGNFFAPPAASQRTKSQVDPVASEGTMPLSRTAEPMSKPRPGEAPEDSVQWYAHVGGDNRGPLNSRTITQWIENGEIAYDTLVWRAGFDDWQTAAVSFPEKFGRAPRREMETIELRTGSPGAHGLNNEVAKQLSTPRGWILFTAISGIIFGSLSTLFFVVEMIVAAESRLPAFSGSQRVVYGLTGLVQSGVMIAASILLLRYANSLKSNLGMRELDLVTATKRLRSFWVYIGIVTLIFEIVLFGLIVLFAVIGAAVADSTN